MKFYVYENVLQWVSYRKIVEAATLEEAVELAKNGFSEIDCDEVMLLDYGEVLDVCYAADYPTEDLMSDTRRRK